jgi:hypothetical protein
MEFQKLSNNILMNNGVSVNEKLNYNEGVSESTLLGIFFIALSMR